MCRVNVYNIYVNSIYCQLPELPIGKYEYKYNIAEENEIPRWFNDISQNKIINKFNNQILEIVEDKYKYTDIIRGYQS